MRYALTVAEWRVIEPILPSKPRGVPRVDDRRVLNGICGGANIPPRRNRREPICFSPYLYRDRNLVERFFNRIKHCRRIATRYEKRAANFLVVRPQRLHPRAAPPVANDAVIRTTSNILIF